MYQLVKCQPDQVPLNRGKLVGQKLPLKLRVSEVWNGVANWIAGHDHAAEDGAPVQFEITPKTREAISIWIERNGLGSNAYLFSSRTSGTFHLSTRQYSRIVESWVAEIGLDATAYGTHSPGGPRRP